MQNPNSNMRQFSDNYYERIQSKHSRQRSTMEGVTSKLVPPALKGSSVARSRGSTIGNPQSEFPRITK